MTRSLLFLGAAVLAFVASGVAAPAQPHDWSGIYVGPQAGSSQAGGTIVVGACAAATSEPETGTRRIAADDAACPTAAPTATPTMTPTPPDDDDIAMRRIAGLRNAAVRPRQPLAIVRPLAVLLSGLTLGSDSSGAMTGGLLAGYNFQRGALVYGPEADVATLWTGGTASVTTSAFNGSVSQNWNAHVRARLGWASEDWLFFIAGGYSEANFGLTLQAPGHFASGNQTFVGYNVGGGIEYALSRYASIRAEYLRDTFNNATFTPGDPYFTPAVFSNVGTSTFRGAVDWRW